MLQTLSIEARVSLAARSRTFGTPLSSQAIAFCSFLLDLQGIINDAASLRADVCVRYRVGRRLVERVEFEHRQFDRELEILSPANYAAYLRLGTDVMWTEKVVFEDRTVYIDRLCFG